MNWKKIILQLIKYSFLLFLLSLISILFVVFYYTYNLPRPEKFTESSFIESTKIYDRTGKVILYNIYGEEKREIVPFDKISINIKNAVIASEDTRFYKHFGIDLEGIVRAILIDLKLQSPSQGGSTITQQLIRSVYLTRKKTLARKIREVVLSVELERRYSKDQIFEWYLNKIPFGENGYGVEAASQTYFNKPASNVSLAEAATLAALIPAPSFYSPYGNHKEELLQKKDNILEKMKNSRMITEEEFNHAKNEKIIFSETTSPIKAPHFVMYVKKYLEDKYEEDFLKEKGLRVYTTLDWELQSFAETVVDEADKTNKKYDANNTSLVVLNPKTGEILSLIGSKNYFEKAYPENCGEKPETGCLFEPKFDVATLGKRQPGSAFKPFVYAEAFKKGFLPETILWDAKTEFNPYCNPNGGQKSDINGLRCYSPQNYDGNYRGKTSLRNSLAGSLNLPSVKLLYLAGLKESLKTAKDFGITTLSDQNRYGLSLVLGGGEINLLELVSAYGVFATEGFLSPLVSILKIEDSEGNIIEENRRGASKVLDTKIARQINSILSDNEARTPIFGPNSALYFKDYQVAAKTGTTQNFNDAWTFGYTPFASVGVWVGNNNNYPINKKSGIGLAAPIWRKIMEKILALNPKENFSPPDLTEDNRSPALLGKLEPEDHNTILYYINKENPLGPAPSNPEQDPQYALWQAGIDNWLLQNNKDNINEKTAE
ncbi:MAG: transglycosylase domain-containing protein [Candidatus Staskawiczbacteria bacterium]|nr:transglycosylase domain-containing protein [Candidatus Staskawiczbacteria bacterium]